MSDCPSPHTALHGGTGSPPPVTVTQLAREALKHESNREGAHKALVLFRSYCAQPMPRIPGMDTWIRLAIRIHCGKTPEQAAAGEYAYRWLLFLRYWHSHTRHRARSRFIHDRMVNPAPHQLGL